MTRDALLQALAALPAEAALTLTVGELREALAATETPTTAARVEPATPERWLTASEVAARLACSKRAVYARASEWPFTRRIGTAIRFSEAGLDRWMRRVG